MEYTYVEDIFREIDDEMLDKIYELVDAMGGEIEQIDLDSKYIKINIETAVEAEASQEVNKLLLEYGDKKRYLFRDSPFLMSQLIQKDLGITDEDDEEDKP